METNIYSTSLLSNMHAEEISFATLFAHSAKAFALSTTTHLVCK